MKNKYLLWYRYLVFSYVIKFKYIFFLIILIVFYVLDVKIYNIVGIIYYLIDWDLLSFVFV